MGLVLTTSEWYDTVCFGVYTFKRSDYFSFHSLCVTVDPGHSEAADSSGDNLELLFPVCM